MQGRPRTYNPITALSRHHLPVLDARDVACTEQRGRELGVRVPVPTRQPIPASGRPAVPALHSLDVVGAVTAAADQDRTDQDTVHEVHHVCSVSAVGSGVARVPVW